MLAGVVGLCLLAGCTEPATSPTAEEASDDPPAFEGVTDAVLHTAVSPDGTPTAEVVVRRPDGREVFRVTGATEQVRALPAGVPDRAWLVAQSDEGTEVGLVDIPAQGAASLGLPPAAWEVPRPGSARTSGRHAVLTAPDLPPVLVDLATATATPVDVVADPVVASLSPDGASLLVAGLTGGAVVDTQDPTVRLDLAGATPVEWLDGGTRLLVTGTFGTGVLELSDGGVTTVDVSGVRAAVPDDSGRVVVEIDDGLALTDLAGAEPLALGVAEPGRRVVVDPAGGGVVVEGVRDDGDGEPELLWVPLDGRGPRPVGPAGLDVVAWPGPAGPGVAWFASGEDGRLLLGVDLATGQSVSVGPEESATDAALDVSRLSLSADWRTVALPLLAGGTVDLVVAGLDQAGRVAATGAVARGALAPGGELVVTASGPAGQAPQVAVGSPDGTVVVRIGAGDHPLWVPLSG